MHLPLQLFNSPKFMVATRHKLASTYLHDVFIHYHNISTENMNGYTPWLPMVRLDDSSFEVVRWHNIENQFKMSDIEFNTIISDYIDSFNLLIKNPLNRFISAFIQDYIKPVVDLHHGLASFTQLCSILKDDIDLDTLGILKYNFYKNEFIFKDIASGMVDDIENIICKYFIDMFVKLKLNIESPHNIFYLHQYHRLITSTKFDSSKIKVIDITNTQLSKELNKYNVGVFKNIHINTSGKYIDKIAGLLDNNNKFKDRVITQLEPEIDFYNQILNTF
jgi:hypothetical protein